MVTLAEFRSVFPEFSESADAIAATIGASCRGKSAAGETTYPEHLLRTACYVGAVEARDMQAGRPRSCDPAAFRTSCSAFEADMAVRGQRLVEIDSADYWQRKTACKAANPPKIHSR